MAGDGKYTLNERRRNLIAVIGHAALAIAVVYVFQQMSLAANRMPYVHIVEEDGPAEFAQFCCLLLASVLCREIARELYRKRQDGIYMLYGAAMAGFLLVALEEISWGQRLLGFDTPAALSAINVQGEATLHNIDGLLPLMFGLQLLAGCYGAFSGLAYAWYGRRLWLMRRYRPGFERLDVLVVPVRYAPYFLMVGLYTLTRIFGDCCGIYVGKIEKWRFQEVMETMFYAACVLTLHWHMARLRGELPPERRPGVQLSLL